MTASYKGEYMWGDWFPVGWAGLVFVGLCLVAIFVFGDKDDRPNTW